MGLPLQFEKTPRYWTIVHVLYFLNVGVDVLILAPLAIYRAYKLWQLRNDIFYKRRFVKMTVWLVLVSCFYFIVIRFLADMPRILPQVQSTHDDNHMHDRETVVLMVRLFCYNLSHVIFAGMIVRSWFLYFEYNRGIHRVLQQFALEINQDQAGTDWTLKWDALSPNSNLMYYLAAGWVVFAETCALVGGSVFGNATIPQLMCYLIITALGAVITSKVSRCRDELFLRKELQYLATLCLFIILLFTVIWFVFDDELKALMHRFLFSVAMWTAGYITMKWVSDQYIKTQSRAKQKTPRNATLTRMSLQEILRDNHGFDLFAMHCVREFSIENLMFLFEACHFKNGCSSFGLDFNDENGVAEIEFAPKTSSIQTRHRTISSVQDSKQSFMYIFEKYFRTHSDYSINLSHDTRYAMQLQFTMLSAGKSTATKATLPLPGALSLGTSAVPSTESNLSKQDTERPDEKEDSGQDENMKNEERLHCVQCMQLLNTATVEIWNLLRRDSLLRFYSTPEYKIFVKTKVNKA